MTKLSAFLASAAVIAVAGFSIGSASAAPSAGDDTNGPEFTITIGPGGALSVQLNTPDQGPYDGADDTYVGVINNSGVTVTKIHLVSPDEQIFGFDGDGIDGYVGISANASDNSDGAYGGPIGFFTGVSGDFLSGDVNFLGGLANGASTYFSLEEKLDVTDFGVPVTTGVPEPMTLSLFGAGLVGAAALRRKGKKKA